MLKRYNWRGKTWLFEDDKVPEGAVPADETMPAEALPAKVRAPRNKARTAMTKEAQPCH